jgi:sugar lactone lactonase YvrE
LRPAWAVPGARVSLEGIHLPVPADGPPHVLVGTHDAHVVAASPTCVRIIVPEEARGSSAIRIDELPGETVYLEVAAPLITGIHQVDSPAFDRQGRLYCTMSGSRGTHAPVPLFRVMRDGVREPIAVEIANPTALAWGPEGYLYVSSRFDGQVYRLGPDDHAELYATELGVATGLAFNRDGDLFVGDRSGTILRISADRQVETFATIPSSVAAFHLAFGPDGCLYVAAPTLSTHDPIYRITPDRLIDELHAGFGRPQGLAFDSTGALYVVEALAGQGGLYRLDVTKTKLQPELVLAAPSLVGVAFAPDEGLVVCSNDTVWRLDCQLTPA